MPLVKFSSLSAYSASIPDDTLVHIVYDDDNRIVEFTTLTETVSAALGIEQIKADIQALEDIFGI